jgi:hypothetical protein
MRTWMPPAGIISSLRNGCHYSGWQRMKQGTFSNFGSCIDILLPNWHHFSYKLQGYTWTISGTSQPLPHVAGVFSSRRHLSHPAQIANRISADATPGVIGWRRMDPQPALHWHYYRLAPPTPSTGSAPTTAAPLLCPYAALLQSLCLPCPTSKLHCRPCVLQLR